MFLRFIFSFKIILLVGSFSLAPAFAKKAASFSADLLPASCRGIRVSYFEGVESQGFLGLETPKADAVLIRQALIEGHQDVAWVDEEIKRRDQSDSFIDAPLPHNKSIVHYTRYELQQMKSYLPELCQLLKKQNMNALTFACNADTKESTKNPKNNYSIEELFAQCVLSPVNTQEATWQDYRKSSLALPGNAAELVIPKVRKKNRYDLINQKSSRRTVYVKALHDAIARFVWDAEKKQEISGEESTAAQ